MPPICISARYDTTDKNIEIYSVTNSSGSSSASAGTTSTPISTLIKSIGTNELDLNPTITALPGSDIQLEMRIADTVKDCISTKTRATISDSLKGVIQKIYSTRNNITSDFHGITDPIFQYFKSSNKENIKPRIFLKGDIISSAYFNVRFCIAESGMGVEKWAKNRTRVKVIGTFSEAADPAPRTNPDLLWTLFDDWIEFNSAILNGLFKFPPGSTWKATRINGSSIDKNYALDGCFTYEIVVGLKQGITPISVNGTSGHKELPNDSSNLNYEYFKGNATKNTYLNANASSANASSANATIPNQKDTNALVECYKYIVLKEMGDVMQVLQFFIWCQLYCQEYNREPVVEFPYPDTDEEGNETGTSTPPLLEDVLIYTTDGVVFSLCNMLKVPCLYTGGGHTALHYIPVKESINNILKKTLTEAMDFILAFNRNLKMNLSKSLFTLNSIHYYKEGGRGGVRLAQCQGDLFKKRINNIIKSIDIYNKILINLVNAYIVYIEGRQFTDAEISIIQDQLDLFIKRIKIEINPNPFNTSDDDIDLVALESHIITATIDNNSNDGSHYDGGFLFPQLLTLEYNKGSVNEDGTQRQLKTINKYILLGYLAEPCNTQSRGGTIVDFDNNNFIVGGSNINDDEYFEEPSDTPFTRNLVNEIFNELELLGIYTGEFLIILTLYYTIKELKKTGILIENSSIVVIYNQIVYFIHKNFSYFEIVDTSVDSIITKYFSEYYELSENTYSSFIKTVYNREKEILEMVEKNYSANEENEPFDIEESNSSTNNYKHVIKFIDDTGLYFCSQEDDREAEVPIEDMDVVTATAIAEAPIAAREKEEKTTEEEAEDIADNDYDLKKALKEVDRSRIESINETEKQQLEKQQLEKQQLEKAQQNSELFPIRRKVKTYARPVNNFNYGTDYYGTDNDVPHKSNSKRNRGEKLDFNNEDSDFNDEDEDEDSDLKEIPPLKRINSANNPPNNSVNNEMVITGGSKSKSNKNKTKKHKKSKKQRKNIKNKSKKQKKTRKNKSSKNKK